MNEPDLFDHDPLAALGRVANDAVWHTPMYSTLGEYGEKRRYYNHLNRVNVGEALIKGLKEADPEVLRNFLGNFTEPAE